MGEPERLGRCVASELRSLENELWLSPVSIWELVILKQKGRITLEGDLETLIPRAVRTLPLKEAPVTFEVAREVGRVKLPHRDPADHLLVATARVFDLTLVTADENLLRARVVPVLANI